MDRYARQTQLAGVGEAGQARILRATFRVSRSAGPARLWEREYLERAGALHFAERSDAEPSFVHAAAFQHAQARELAAGAWRALLQLRAALGSAPTEEPAP